MKRITILLEGIFKEVIMSQPKIVLVDDDKMFGLIATKQASCMGVSLDYYKSLDDLGFISRLADYDIILADFLMDDISGLEIAAYMPVLFGKKTVFIISSSELNTTYPTLPDYVTAFLHKEQGIEEIIRKSIEIHQSQELTLSPDLEKAVSGL